MGKRGKRYRSFKVDKKKKYSADEALRLIVDHPMAEFDEMIDISVGLSVDTKQSNQQVRGSASLPHGLGKKVRVAVFTKGENEQKSKDAGADWVGGDDLIAKIKGGWMEFDCVIASPDLMPALSKIAPMLGPKGLMPNPKMGTVTKEPHLAVQAEKKGKASFKAVQSGKNGLIHSSIGRRSLGFEKLKDNFNVFMENIIRAKPPSSKGVYLRSIGLSSTMGPGLSVDVGEKTF